MGFPEKIDAELQRQAEEALHFAEDLIDWTSQYGPARRDSEVGAVSPQQEFELFRLRREAQNLYGSSKVPPAAAVYGASQSGKSLFVSRMLEPHDPRYSPLGLADKGPGYLEQLSFNHDMNPQCGDNEATALVTRFSTANRLKTNPPPAQFPVTVRALSRAEWLKVLGRGTQYECVVPTDVTWDEEQLEALFDEISNSDGANEVDRQWRLDLFDVYSYMRRLEPRLYKLEESLFNGFLSKYPLTEEGYIKLAARLFWFSDKFPELTKMFREVNSFLETLQLKSRDNSLAIHWAAVRFLLDSQLKTQQQSKDSQWQKTVELSDIGESFQDGWYVLDYQGAGSPLTEQKLAVIQSALLEMTVPVVPQRLNEDWRAVIEDMDVLDIPGARAAGKNLESADTLKKRLNIVKRGKVDYLFDRYIEERQVQTVFLLVRFGNLEVKEQLKLYLDKWGRIRYGEDAWPRKVRGENALFIGMTGIDKEFEGRTITSSLYDTRLDILVTEALHEIMTDFGGPDRRFRNVYPIRYPGTWDKNHEERQTSKPEQWDEAERAFTSSRLVGEYVEDAERRWKVAMLDNDGGLSLIGAGFREVTSASQKRDAIKRQLDSVSAAIRQLGQRWYCDPNAKLRHDARMTLGKKIVAWLRDDETINHRVFALESALCIDEGDAMQLAECVDMRGGKTRGRPEPIEQRFPKELRRFLEEWAARLAPTRWQEETQDNQDGAPWLETEDFVSLAAYLQDYLCSPDVFGELSDILLKVVGLKLKDQAMLRHARRQYVRLILNDYIMNPGPSIGPLAEPEEANGHDFGLMAPFLTRWQGRLPFALAAGAGDNPKIPGGNEELLELLESYF